MIIMTVDSLTSRLNSFSLDHIIEHKMPNQIVDTVAVQRKLNLVQLELNIKGLCSRVLFSFRAQSFAF